MDNDTKDKFFKKLVERTLKLDAERKSEQKIFDQEYNAKIINE